MKAEKVLSQKPLLAVGFKFSFSTFTLEAKGKCAGLLPRYIAWCWGLGSDWTHLPGSEPGT